MSTAPFISVIVPVRNEARFIEATLASSSIRTTPEPL
jgi:cellulose synthase/poly-beta-1,6-N-acetylglucosamine synthase-like glycosyltransferase